MLIVGKAVRQGLNLGVRESFADLAATIADILQVAPPPNGRSFKDKVLISAATAGQDELPAMIEADPALMAGLIDHTLLRADARSEEVEQLCAEALQYGFASVCVNPTHVALVAERLASSPVLTCAVVGFPLGATTTGQKVFETEQVVQAGAQEVDMVINIGALKDGDLQFVEQDIAEVVQAAHAGHASCKVIIETVLLSDTEKVQACELSKRAGADFVKTSTGFSTSGATTADVALMRETVGAGLGVKASGGVRTAAKALAMVNAGANRIGSTKSVAIMDELLQ